MEYNTQETGGTIIIADSVSRKILSSKTMTNNEDFNSSFNPALESFINGLKNIGIDPANMKLSLYFIPNEEPASEGTK